MGGTVAAAGRDATLVAGRNLALTAIADNRRTSSTNWGLTLGLSGGQISIGGDYSKALSSDQIYNNALLSAGREAQLVSGADMTLQGAMVAGNSVVVSVGNNLLIESLPNLSTAKALSVSANLGINPAAAFPISSIGGTFQKANGSYAGVEQQSGIYAGSGGFDIAVKGNAKLKGALIESTAAADKNYLSAQALGFENIAVHSTYSAMSFAGQISATGAPSFAPPQFANSNEKGTVWTAVSPATISITGGALQTQNLANLRRDTLKTNPELNALPNLQAILSDQGRTMKEYQQAAQIVATGIGDLAGSLQQQALARGDTATAKLWGEGGAYRAIMHSIAGGVLGGVNGLDGAVQGAAGGAVSTLIIPVIDKAIRDAMIARGLDPDKQGSAAAYFKNLIAGLLVNGVTTAVSGTNGGAYAGNNYDNNFLTHRQMQEAIEAYKNCRGDKACIERVAKAYEELDFKQQSTLEFCPTVDCVAYYAGLIEEGRKEWVNDILELQQYNDAHGQRLWELQVANGGMLIDYALNSQIKVIDQCGEKPSSSCRINVMLGEAMAEGISTAALATLGGVYSGKAAAAQGELYSMLETLVPRLAGETTAAWLKRAARIVIPGKVVKELVPRTGKIDLNGVSLRADELAAAEAFAKLGYDVKALLRNLTGPRKADFEINGIGLVDSYTPNNLRPTTIARALEEKLIGSNVQAQSVVVNVPADYSKRNMYEVAVRFFNKHGITSSANSVYFNAEGKLIQFDRSVVKNIPGQK